MPAQPAGTAAANRHHRLDDVLTLGGADVIFEPRMIAAVKQRLVEDRDRARTELGSGAQLVGDDPTATGMRTARYVGRIEGLTRAIAAFDEVEEELSGKAKTRERK